VPSAFTLSTGKDHWYPLLRARAIETQCWVLAPAQQGRHDDQGLRESYGHSVIIDPWGQVVASVGDGMGWAIAEIDLARCREIRRAMPVQAHRVAAGLCS
jgi:nitrilase